MDQKVRHQRAFRFLTQKSWSFGLRLILPPITCINFAISNKACVHMHPLHLCHVVPFISSRFSSDSIEPKHSPGSHSYHHADFLRAREWNAEGRTVGAVHLDRLISGLQTLQRPKFRRTSSSTWNFKRLRPSAYDFVLWFSIQSSGSIEGVYRDNWGSKPFVEQARSNGDHRVCL